MATCNICDQLHSSECVVYTGDVSSSSSLTVGDNKVAAVLLDIYTIVGALSATTILIADNTSLTYTVGTDGFSSLQEVLTTHSELLNTLKISLDDLTVATSASTDISALDLSCLATDPCYTGTKDIVTVLQLIINKICV